MFIKTALPKGEEVSLSDMWAPLATTDNLASPTASSSLQEACCPGLQQRVHDTALGLACCWGPWVP